MKRDELEIQEPCTESWGTMDGDNVTRFCGQCQKNVHNLSGMKRDDAERFIENSGDGVCVVYQFDHRSRAVRFADAPIHERAVPMAQLIGAKRLVAAAAVAIPLLMATGCDTSESCFNDSYRPIDIIEQQELAFLDALADLVGFEEVSPLNPPMLMGAPAMIPPEPVEQMMGDIAPTTVIEVVPVLPPPQIEHQIRDQLDTQVEPNQPPARLIMGRMAPTRLKPVEEPSLTWEQ